MGRTYGIGDIPFRGHVRTQGACLPVDFGQQLAMEIRPDVRGLLPVGIGSGLCRIPLEILYG